MYSPHESISRCMRDHGPKELLRAATEGARNELAAEAWRQRMAERGFRRDAYLEDQTLARMRAAGM